MERFSADVRDFPGGGHVVFRGYSPVAIHRGCPFRATKEAGLIIPAAYRVVLEADSLVV